MNNIDTNRESPPLPERISGRESLGGIIDALLRAPARITSSGSELWIPLFAIAAAAMLLYGVMMGMYAGGDQLVAVPAKVLLGFFGAALISFPSFYILTCMSGSLATAKRIGTTFLGALALSAVLLAGFVPVVWLFGESTEAIAFMGSLHIAIAYFAISGAFSKLSRLLGDEEAPGRRLHFFWNIIFLMVIFQMSASLRPLLGPEITFFPTEKRFFLQHWMLCLGDVECKAQPRRVNSSGGQGG